MLSLRTDVQYAKEDGIDDEGFVSGLENYTSVVILINLNWYQYIKEYIVGHRARKRDHFARASFVSIVWGGGEGNWWSTQRINNQQFCQSTPDSHFVDLGKGEGNRHGEDQQSTFTFVWRINYRQLPFKCAVTPMQWLWSRKLRSLCPPDIRAEHGLATSVDIRLQKAHLQIL